MTFGRSPARPKLTGPPVQPVRGIHVRCELRARVMTPLSHGIARRAPSCVRPLLGESSARLRRPDALLRQPFLLPRHTHRDGLPQSIRKHTIGAAAAAAVYKLQAVSERPEQ